MSIINLNIQDTTYVASAEPSNNFSAYPLLYVGTDPVYHSCVSLLKITLPELQTIAVDSAILKLSVIVKSGDTPSTIVVNKVTSPFDVTTVNYATMPAYAPTQTKYDVLPTDLYQQIFIDITSLVNEWISGVTENNGIALTNSDGYTLVQFASDKIVYNPYFPTITLTYTEAPVVNSATDFNYAQLANIIEQIITMYPNTITVYTRGFNAATVTGIPVSLFKSSSGTYGSLFILDEAGEKESIPISSIAAIYTGEGTVYNPSITYLTPPEFFTKGYDANLLTAFYEYLPVSTNVTMYMGTLVEASGTVYRNEYGIIVLAEGDGNTPLFVPVYSINVILPRTPTITAENIENPNSVTISLKS